MMLAVAGLVLSMALLMASLWQIEICTGWAKDVGFDMPFYLIRKMNWAVARDLWYTVNILSWVLAAVSAYYLGVSA